MFINKNSIKTNMLAQPQFWILGNRPFSSRFVLSWRYPPAWTVKYQHSIMTKKEWKSYIPYTRPQTEARKHATVRSLAYNIKIQETSDLREDTTGAFLKETSLLECKISNMFKLWVSMDILTLASPKEDPAQPTTTITIWQFCIRISNQALQHDKKT